MVRSEDGDVVLGAADHEEDLFSSPGYAQTEEHSGRTRRGTAEAKPTGAGAAWRAELILFQPPSSHPPRPIAFPGAPPSADHKVCMVYVDVDAASLQSMGGDMAATLQRVRNLMAEVEAVYDGELPSFDVRLRGVHVNPNLVPFGTIGSSSDMLTFYQRWLASNPTNQSKDGKSWEGKDGLSGRGGGECALQRYMPLVWPNAPSHVAAPFLLQTADCGVRESPGRRMSASTCC